jgi:hypothetical protein
MAFIMLHNVTIENDQILKLEPSLDVRKNITFKRGLSFEDHVEGTIQIENHDFHSNLQNDLIKHLWQLKGNN